MRRIVCEIVIKPYKKSVAVLIVLATLLTVISALPLFKADAVGTTTKFYNWKQYDPQWKDVYIGNDTIGNIGCYATSAAMLIVYGGLKTEENFDPATFVYTLKEAGGFSGNLIYKGKINKAVPGFDYMSEVLLGKTKAEKTESIAYYLNKGYYIIAGVRNLGHYVAIREVKDGVVYMMDPASESTVLFDYYAVSGVTKIFLYTSTGKKAVIGDTLEAPPPKPGVDVDADAYVTGVYKTTSDLNLRQLPTTSSASLGVIPLGTEITVTETDGPWGKTSFGGIDGYVYLAYTTLISADDTNSPDDTSKETSSNGTSSEDTSYDDSSYDDPSSDEPSSDEPSSDEPSSDEPSSDESSSDEPSSDEPSSDEPSSDDSSDDSSGDTSDEIPPQYEKGIYKTTGNLNLRSEPNTSSSILTFIPKGTEITVTEVRNGKWGKTSYGGFEGYCGLSYASFIAPLEEPKVEIPVSTTTNGTDGQTKDPVTDGYSKGYYIVSQNLNLREGVGTSTSRLAIIPAGTKLKVTEIKDGWGKVVYSQLVGWCSLEYCTFDSSYLEETVISAGNIVGVIGEEADLSSLSVNKVYSDGSVYSIKNGIKVSYVIPTSPSVISAKAVYEGAEYEFKILYTEKSTVKTAQNATYVLVESSSSSKDVFGVETIEIKTNVTAEIGGITFTVVVSGDIDGTGDISATDYLLIKQTFLGNHNLAESENFAADVDNDGEITATDYLTIKNLFLK